MSPFTNLRFLELHLVNDSDKFSQRIVALVRHNPDLQCLLVRVYRHLPDNADYDFDGPYKRRESHFRSSLARPAKTRLPIVHFEDFHLAPLQNVYSVSFGKNAADHEASRVDPYHKFDYLHIDGDLQKLEESVLVPFLKGCDSGSRYVPCLGTVFQNQPEIVGALLETGFALKVLHFERFLFNDDLVAIISSSSQWTNIWLETSAVAGCVADAIVENCANLEALEIMYSVDSGYETTAYGMNGPRMQAILSKASHLKTLLAHWIVNVDDKMTSRDILSSEWATTSLEHVDFKIAVPRADDDESTVRITIESSHAIQRQILRRLGQQKNLRKLVLGGAVISTTTGELGWHNSCLEMTLESGLDELAGLKSLEELNIRDMDHLMNEPEIKWMAENLPKLARVKGLFDNDHPPRELKDWISAHKPGWEV
ncbi:hypothetical protein BGZ73_002008 [Actinomortierella ambigua]|nr:hypothetical protein BGZ73_002008 [Actinomortierella ambigua]